MSEKKIDEKRKCTKEKQKILLNIDHPLDFSIFYRSIEGNNQIKINSIP